MLPRPRNMSVFDQVSDCLIFCPNISLWTYVFVLNCLKPVLLVCYLLFHLVYHLLSDMREHQVAVMLPECLPQKLLAAEYHLVESLFRDVEVVLLRIRGPIDGRAHRGHTTELILLSNIFLTTMCSCDVCSFFLIFQSLTDLFRSSPLVAVYGDDLQKYFVKSKRNNRHLYYILGFN